MKRGSKHKFASNFLAYWLFPEKPSRERLLAELKLVGCHISRADIDMTDYSKILYNEISSNSIVQSSRYKLTKN